MDSYNKIKELEQELADLKAAETRIRKGTKHWTAWGYCEVQAVYTEDGAKKVRGLWQRLCKHDFGECEGEPYLRSMPVEKLKLGIAQYPAFKRQRELEIKHGAA